MTDHRAPSRLATSSRTERGRVQSPPDPSAYRLPSSPAKPIPESSSTPESQFYNPYGSPEEPLVQPLPVREINGHEPPRPGHRHPYPERQYEDEAPGVQQVDEPGQETPDDAESHRPWRDARQTSAPVGRAAKSQDEELSKAERHQILIDTIKLYDEDWQLARIWARGETNWLVAYLVPRDKRMDLSTALRKNKALTIIIDSRGNTQVKLPKRRKWFFGLF